MLTFTPLSGAAHSTRTTPLCFILQVDDVKILLDCGSPDWSPEASTSEVKVEDTGHWWEEYCSLLRQHAPNVDLVLLSHGDLQHSGLYPYAYSKWNLKAQTYTTLPVQAMARIAASEDVEGLRDEEDVDVEGVLVPEAQPVQEQREGQEEERPQIMRKVRGKYVATLQEVQDAFDSVNVLRYSQPCHLQGKCQGITITPFNAGHTLGGTIWKIRSPSSGTILYAVNMNHMRERHLDGTILIRQAGGIFEPLARPDLFITDADRANVITSRRKDRDASLIDTVTTALSSRSSLLLPCDSGTRLLELLVLLDQHWNYSRLRYPICLVSRTGREMLTFVRSMMEWLGGTISKEDVGEDGTNGRRGNKRKRADEDVDEDALGAFALRFQHLEFFPTPQALLQTYSSKDPKLILAVPLNLSHGPSRSIFSEFAAIPDNVILLTQRGDPGTFARGLFDKWNDSQRAEVKWDKGKVGSNVMLDENITLKMHSKVPLQGEELEEFMAKERAAKEKEAAQQAAAARNQRMLEADEGESESDEDSDAEDDAEEKAFNDEMMDMDGDVPRKGDAADWAGMDADEGYPKQLVSFDIYLKGNVSKATSFFRNASTQAQQRFRMFPYVEKKRRVDEYGETIDVGMWLRKGKVFEEEAETDEVKEARRKQQEEDEEKRAILEPPSKFVETEVEVQMACRLLFVDMEGLNDSRAVKTIVPKVNPRKMIVVHATTEAADSLIESCGNIQAMTKDIYAPTFGQSVQIGQQTSSFSISISDELLASLRMSRFEDNEVGYITGRVVMHATTLLPTLEPAAKTAASATPLPARAPRILGTRPKAQLPRSTMIGELKLTALKARLAQIGVQAELVGEGVLICGAATRRSDDADPLAESVAVRKTARGNVEMEGNISETYYAVRKEIYNLHALVSA
ncbi:beta-lactamase-like protein [Schizophyllum amplum]|uniref:Cleavage and polyadenylation specificity factor subunit 2 n=1 Tax=Schizophyllum amplum TaxID=97359 RepID=A0A550CTJ9_9AGAR|nr:beta-lactamase-like protein [Auriculariopsis ampla]